MKKVILDNLPKWEEDSRHKGKIKWKDCIGYKVKFIYDDIEDETKIVDYKYPIVTIEYKGNNFSYANSSFLNCPFGIMLGKINKEYIFDINQEVNTITGSILILEQIKINRGKDNVRGYKYKCLKDGNIDTISEYHLKVGKGCTVCGNKKVLKGINDIATTHPHLIGYFINKNEAYSVSHGSEKELLMKCKDCGYKRKRVIKDFVRNGFACPKCSDGFSYPEKFTFSALSQLGIEFIVQYNPEWIKPKRYDFFVPSFNCIIETHGEQHYHNSFKNVGSRDLKAEKDNDKLKQEVALRHGVSKYIILDCQESELAYIRHSIENSELKNMCDLSKIDWLKCHEFAFSTRVKEVSNIWNKGIHSTIEIGKIINLHSGTVRLYLKRGRELGWNDYNEYVASIRGGLIQQKKVICLNTLEVFDSSKGIEDKYNVNRAQVNQICNNKFKYIKIGNEPFVFMFYDNYINNEVNVKDILNDVFKIFEKKRQKQVVCLNTNQIFITLKEASEKFNISYSSIINCCKGLQNYAGIHPESKEKLIWMYLKDYEVLSENEINNILLKQIDKKIIQLTKDLEYVREFSSINVASKLLNIDKEYISENVRGKRKTTNGFIFVDKDKYINNQIIIDEHIHKSRAKFVLKLDKNGNVLEEFDSVMTAMNDTGVKHISSVCRGERKTAGGFKWMYKEDYY